MDNELVLTGVYDVDVNNLIATLNQVKLRLKACSDAGASNQNFVQLWHNVNGLHNEIHTLTERLRMHEKQDDIIHTEQNERIEGLEQVTSAPVIDQLSVMKAAAHKVCSTARHTVLTLVNTDTGERTSLMTVGKECVEELRNTLDY